MAVWEVRDRKGSWKVEAANWLSAAGEVVEARGLTALEVSSLMVEIQAAGIVRLRDFSGVYDMEIARAAPIAKAPPVEDITEDTGPLPVPVSAKAPVAQKPVAAKPVEAQKPVAAKPVEAQKPVAAKPVEAQKPVAARPVEAQKPAAAKPVEAQKPAAAKPVEAQKPVEAPMPVVVPVLPPAPVVIPDPAELPVAHLPSAPAEEAWSGELDSAELAQANKMAERLFLEGDEIAGARSPEAAAAAALRILLSVVPAESGAVLQPAESEMSLRFTAAQGPKAAEVRGMTVPWGKGIAGFCMGTGAVLMVRDAVKDPHHMTEIDNAVGYETREMVAAAVRDEEGDIHGCIELINPVGGFERWHLDAIRSVATSLADYMRRRA